MSEQRFWQAVLEHDRAFDGEFVYAVRTTGIFCRPSCGARRPQRANVAFFDGVAAAAAAGFRPCRRCHPAGAAPEPHLDVIAAACRQIAAADEPPSLAALATTAHLAPTYFQRVFKRVVGVSPRQYADAQRRARLKAALHDEPTVTAALYQAGYGATSSLYTAAAEHLGMTPGAYRGRGRAMTIRYALAPCALGWLLVAATEQGVCSIALGDDGAALAAALGAEFAAATVQRDDDGLALWVKELLEHLAGARPHLDLPLDVQATAFQRQVWEALQRIPYGATRSYGAVAAALGQPTAARAVARACATNPVALAVPCHRVVREGGALGGYRWGLERKAALLDQERAAENR